MMRTIPIFVLCTLAMTATPAVHGADRSLFNVKDYGATGRKDDDARPAIQKAIDACATAGGGVVYVPPGEYTCGALHLRSHLRFELEAGATIFASTNRAAYDVTDDSQAALFFGEGLENVTLCGRGTVDGQAEYVWIEDDFERAFKHKTLMQSLGKSLLRSVPKGFPTRPTFPHLLWLGASKDIQVTGVKFLHSPSWTLTFSTCDRVVLDGVYIYTSLKEGVWADGIDLNGCRDFTLVNSTIETGDDCLAIFATDVWGPARACENIRVSNCRLSSASAGIKFTEGNKAGIHRVLVSNTVLTNVNRGFVFLTTLGGDITDIVLSDLVIDCNRFDWFWAGDGQPFFFRPTRLSELTEEPAKPGEAAPGAIRNVTIRNVLAHAKGSSLLHGHRENPLDGLSLDHVRFFLRTDPAAPFDQAGHALHFQWAKNLRLNDVSVQWEEPSLPAWKSALSVEDSSGLDLDGFVGRAAWPDRGEPAVRLNRVTDALIRHARAPEGTGLFLKVSDGESHGICLQANDLRRAKTTYQLDKGVRRGAVELRDNLPPRK